MMQSNQRECPVCRGEGTLSRKNAEPRQCNHCRGEGVVTIPRFTDNGVLRPCPDCDGADKKCQTCGGDGLAQQGNYSWTLDLNIGHARKLKTELDWDIWDSKAIDKLYDPQEVELQVDIVWTIIERQVAARNITPEEFAERLGGSADIEAHEALLEAVANFFTGRGAAELARTIQRRSEIMAKAHAKGVTKIDESADGIAARVDALMDSEFSKAQKQMKAEMDQMQSDGLTSGESPVRSE